MVWEANERDYSEASEGGQAGRERNRLYTVSRLYMQALAVRDGKIAGGRESECRGLEQCEQPGCEKGRGRA